ncbi:hypothetical protein ACHAQH_002955 [Verticillium albo-atrum]
MVDRPNKPTALATTPGLPPQAQVTTSDDNSRVDAVLPTGESISILLHGATVLSWKDAAGNDRLWLSEAATLDGTKPVRGGIPLVFPVFGQAPDHDATKNLPQHGFARSSRWEFLGKSSEESGTNYSVKLDFGLASSGLDEATKAAWGYRFGAIYSVTLDRDALSTSLVITNEDDKPFEFQVLLHTYLRVPDVTALHLLSLDAAPYLDKTESLAAKTQSGPLALTGETDRIYTPTGGPKVPIVVADATSGRKLYSLTRDNLDDVVVWNPWEAKAKSMPDFSPDEGWRNMVCVEAGAVKGWQKLEAGDAFEAAQVITAGGL